MSPHESTMRIPTFHLLKPTNAGDIYRFALHSIELQSSKCKCPLVIVDSDYLISSVLELFSDVLEHSSVFGSRNGSIKSGHSKTRRAQYLQSRTEPVSLP